MTLLPILFLLFWPEEIVEANCHDHSYGVSTKSCKRIKDPKFQIRGPFKIVPMWQYVMFKEPVTLRSKRSAASGNTTSAVLPVVESAGRTVYQQQPVPLANSNLKWYPPNIGQIPPAPTRLIPPGQYRASSPLPSPLPPQRHILQNNIAQPTNRPAPIHAGRASNPSPLPPQRYPKPIYPTLSPLPHWGNGVASQAPQTGAQHAVQTNNNSPPIRPVSQQSFPYKNNLKQGPLQPQKEVDANKQSFETSFRPGENGENGGEKKKHRGGKKKKKEKNSRMCKMCAEMSEEEDSEEKEVACSSKGKLREKENGQLHSAGKKRIDSDDESGEDGTDESEEEETSQPTILDFAERAKQNKLMRIPVYRGKKLIPKDEYAVGDGEGDGEGYEEDKYNSGEGDKSKFASNIREGAGEEHSTKYDEAPNVKYSYPPKDTLPLQTCFHNPSGYVCCNLELNNVVESTYKELREQPDFNPCNLQLIANKVQRATEKMFDHPFETIAAHADFAQNVNFAGDLVCKLEIDGKYMIAYGTPYHADEAVGPQGPDGTPLPVRTVKKAKH